jgi:hypothetical protein
MITSKRADKFDNAPACRAKAASFRTIADQTKNVDMKMRALKLAAEWEARAAGYEED